MTASLMTAEGTAEPFYFKSGESDLFGWLHRPAAPDQSNLGVVICSPYGYESICAHRSVRAFAEAITGAGIPALRFDYRSTGDSSEIDADADHVGLWTQDVTAAIRELRSRAGVSRVCLLGIRLGALLASLAAVEQASIESLILVGPVVNGRRFVRELRTTQLAGLAMAASPAPEEAAGRPASKTVEAGGFSFSAATIDSLARVDLLKVAAPAVQSMLILDNDKLPSAKSLVASWLGSGMVPEYRTVPGLIEMAMTAPQFAAVPQAMIEATREWLMRLCASTADATNEVRSASREPSPAAMTMVLAEESPDLPETVITERPVFPSSAGTPLFGIVTEPGAAGPRRRAVILLNAGADFHIGASRMYVSFARRWARHGYFVLRLDFAGIGDSPTRPGNRDDEVFPDEAIIDIRSAIEFMRERYDISDVTVAGLCSGAYHALRAAAAGLDIDRVLMVNPQNYFWKKGMTLEQVQLAEVAHNPGLYRQRLFSWTAWRRIFKGEVDIGRIAVIYLQRLRLASDAPLRSLGRLLGIRLSQDLAWELEKIVGRGIRVIFVFARGEPGLELLNLQAGSAVSSLGDNCRIRIVDSGDHIFSRREPRVIMENVLSEELFAHAGGAPTDPPTPSAPRAAPSLRQASSK